VKDQIWEAHDVIYHYTAQSGLYGILENQTLHATHYAYLNDTTEMVQIKEQLKAITTPVVLEMYRTLAKKTKEAERKMETQGGIDTLASHDTSTVIESLYRVTFGIDRKHKFFQPFVTSFCSHADEYAKKNGLLSQWRAYGREVGYALILRTKELADLLGEETKRYFYNPGGLGDVIYEGQEELFTKEFKALIGAIEQAAPAILRGEQAESIGLLFGPFVDAVSRYKHRAFSEEREVRLFMSPMDEPTLTSLKAETPPKITDDDARSLKQVHFKENLTPYIVLFEGINVKLPITRIVVGPHREKELRAQKIRRYLETKQLKIDVACSETPLV
jgi:hypothetical protein